MTLDERFVRVTEVGPRDGLQNEPEIVSSADKIALVDALSAAGFPEIETTSFVSPRWVPQLADATEVLQAVHRRPGTLYSALVPNARGLERAVEAGADKFAVFTAASEAFCHKNLNATIAESIERFEPVFRAAAERSLPVRGYISCVVACPYEGRVDPASVRETVERLIEAAGPSIEIALGDTLGVAEPDDIDSVLGEVSAVVAPRLIDLHLHDTNGRALEGVARALDHGVRAFDSSCAGLGGCPYAPGASGNLATEALLEMLHRDGWRTGIDVGQVSRAAELARRITGR